MVDLVLYHEACPDGFCAAWLIHQKWPDAQYVPMQYGKEPPDVTGKDVIVADFSFSRAKLLEMKEKAKGLLLLDHHATAETDLKDLGFCVFDMKRSGAMIVWDHLFGGEAPPIVQYVQDRDLWSWKLPNSHEVSACIASYARDFHAWTC